MMAYKTFLDTRWLGVAATLAALSCSAGSGGLEPGGGNGDGDDDTGGGDSHGGTSGIGSVGGLDIDTDPQVDGPATPGCADGVLTPDEACDDGNLDDGDGCAANCRSQEPGWSCPEPGEACIRIARCGDGYAVFPELCDDGNVEPGDGCSATCKVEVGFKCDDESPSSCTTTKCGDGKQEGAESCEDDDILPFDGCSTVCQAEPDCSGGACVSACGDGLVLGEACDDGNNTDGDGCSADCQEEEDDVCVTPEPGTFMTVPAVFRDFRASHSDFEPQVTGSYEAVTGLVEARLDEEGKPVYTGAGGHISSKASFAEWYRDVPETNSTTVSAVTLWSNGAGRFVNRWGPNGEQWLALTPPGNVWCGQVGMEIDGEPCTSQYGTPDCDAKRELFPLYDCIVNPNDPNAWSAIFIESSKDGNPVFFPVDGDPFTPDSERAAALISTFYGGNWDEEEGSPLHNFHFTSEVRYWFQYTAGESYILDFTGDDDVWVFINGHLAVDLGGIHTAVNGHLTIDEAGIATVTTAVTNPEEGPPQPAPSVDLELEDGSVYEIAVLHAERQKAASTFKLTLEGFTTARSECTPICGDGIVSLGEECDDGVNDGGYGRCGDGCRLGDFCGDGILQAGEDCDDGNNIDGDGCGSGCRDIIVT